MMSDVFVIGAGCSVPYGFPTGAMLMQKLKNFNYGEKNQNNQHDSLFPYLFDIYQESLGTYQKYTQLKNSNGPYFFKVEEIEGDAFNKTENIVAPFAQSIRHSMMVSTDEFLKNRLSQVKSDEADFGKRLIAREILMSERDSMKSYAIVDGKREQKKQWLGNIDWIQHLLSRIDQQEKWEEILKQTVFLTFNYDRVLEYCLFLYLTSDKQYDSATALSFIKKMHIFHINGFIGPLENIPFGCVENGKYQDIAKGMETVWEKRQNRDESEKQKYQEILKNANRVYFLGFSYIPDNLDSIGIDRGAEIIHDAKVYATAMGLSPQNRLRVASYLNINEFEKRKEIEEYDDNRILKDASAESLILDYYTFE